MSIDWLGICAHLAEEICRSSTHLLGGTLVGMDIFPVSTVTVLSILRFTLSYRDELYVSRSRFINNIDDFYIVLTKVYFPGQSFCRELRNFRLVGIALC
jgi:hypothetical protein